MFEGIKNGTTLKTIMFRMRVIQRKLNQGKQLTEEDEKYLKLTLFGIEGERIEFRNDEHRNELIAQWWAGARLLAKRFKEETEKAKR